MSTRIEIETELTFKVRLSALVDPAEPEVGLSAPIINDLAIEEIIGIEPTLANAKVVRGDEGERVVRVGFDYHWTSGPIKAEIETLVDDMIVEAYNESEGGHD